MQLFVYASSFSRVIPCEPTDSVQHLKSKIQELENIGIEDQFLSFGCKPLRDALSLDSYGIHEGSVIGLNVRLRGGSEAKVFPKSKLYEEELLSARSKYREMSMDGALNEVQSSRNILPFGYQNIEMLQEAFKSMSKQRLDQVDTSGCYKLGSHTNSVFKVKTSKDCKYVISMANDCTVKVFDYETKQEIASFEEKDQDDIHDVVYEDDQKYVIAAHESEYIRLIDFESKNDIHRFPIKQEGSGSLKALTVSNDSNFMACGFSDGSLRFFNLPAKQQKASYQNIFKETVSGLEFSRDCKYFVAASEGGILKLFDVASEKEIYEIETNSGKIKALVISDDNQYIIAAAWWEKSIKIFDLKTKELLYHLEKAAENQIEAIALSSDNKYLMVGSWSPKIRVYDFETKQLIHVYKTTHTATIGSLKISKNNRYLISGSWDHSVKLSELEIQHCLHVFEDTHKSWLRKVAITNDNKCIVSIGGDSSIKFYDLNTKKDYCIENAHNSDIQSMTLSPDNKYLATGGSDYSIKVFDFHTKEPIIEFPKAHTSSPSTLAVSRNNRYLVSGSWNNDIKVFDLNMKSEICHFPKAHNSSVLAVAITSDNNYIVSGGSSDKAIKIFSIPAQKEVYCFEKAHDGYVSSICLTSDNQYIISASHDLSIKIFSLKTKQLVHSFTKVHEGIITSLALTKDNKYLISAACDKTIKIFDLETFVQLHHFKNISPYNFSCLSVSNDSKYIVAGTYDKTIHVLSFPYENKNSLFPRSAKIPAFLTLGAYEQYILNIESDAVRAQNMEMFHDLYFIPYNWTLLHLLAIFEPDNICTCNIYTDFKIPFLVDFYGNTPLHYLISHTNIDYDSVNFMFKYILDYLEDKEVRTFNETRVVIDSLSNIMPFILSKTNTSLVKRFLNLCYATPSTAYRENLPKFGESGSRSCFVKEPVLTPEVRAQIHQKGKDQVSFSTLKLKLDYSPLSDDMLNNILTLNELDNEDYYRSKAISSLIAHLWSSSRVFHGLVGLVFCALMVLISIYVGIGDINRGLEIVIIILAALFAVYEGFQMVTLRSKYLSSIWNITDLCFYGLVIATMITRFANSDNELAQHWLFSVIIITGYVRLMSYLRLFTPTRNLIQTILTILKDMWGFMIIIVLILFGFALIFLEFNRDLGYGDHLYQTYGRLFGNFDDSEFNASQKFFNSLIVFFFTVILLNMLVSIMGDSYGKVQESHVLTDSQTKVQMILESMIFLRLFAYKRAETKRYIMFCEERSSEEEDDSAGQWEGGIQVLKRLIQQNDSKVKNLNQEVKQLRQEMRENYQDIMKSIRSLQLQPKE